MNPQRLATSVVNRRMLVALVMGFSCGLPLLMTLSVLQAWMKDTGVDLTTIGLMSLVGLPYTLKFFWAPVFDRYALPFLGRRRGWLLVSQLALMASLVLLGANNPSAHPELLALAALAVSFFSASQDIVVDAYRREDLPDRELGLGSSLYINGYRIGMLLASGGGLILADHIPYFMVYLIMALCLLPGTITTMLTPEPRVPALPVTLKAAVVDPLVEYFSRTNALWILAFILMYKIGDTMAAAMTTPFYLDRRLFKNPNRCRGQAVRILGHHRRYYFRRHCHDSVGHPSQSMAFRHPSGHLYRRVLPAGRHRAQPGGIVGGDRFRKLERRHGDLGLCRLYGQHHGQAFYGHPVCPLDQPHGHPPGTGIGPHRLSGNPDGLAGVFHPLHPDRYSRPAAALANWRPVPGLMAVEPLVIFVFLIMVKQTSST